MNESIITVEQVLNALLNYGSHANDRKAAGIALKQLAALYADLAAKEAECARLRKLLADVSSWTEKRMPQIFRDQVAIALDAQPQEK